MDLEQRKVWNEKHKELTAMIGKSNEHQGAVELFLIQHGILYSSQMGNMDRATYEDELLEGIEEVTFRRCPVPCTDTKNSIAWHLWHIARVEDITMNILVAGSEQVLYSDNWLQKMNTWFTHSGNNMSEADIASLSSCINIDSLLAYRIAVGQQTRRIISSLQPGGFNEKVQPGRIKRLFDENAVTQEAKWLADYWSNKSIAGLVLMPATRHNFLHMNKCIRIKHKIQKDMKQSLL